MRTFGKYLAFARIAAAQSVGERGELYGRMAFLAVILGVTALWKAVAQAGMPVAASPSGMVWYLAATEWILLSPAPAHVDIESEIRRGDVACQIVRPFSYLAALAAQGAGRLLVRAPALAVVAFVCAFGFTGDLPPASRVAYLLPFAVASMTVIHAMYVLLGLMAFWLGDIAPLFWIWQKLLFVLGGLMFPLSIYPAWLQHAAHYTPFPWLLAGPAGFLLSVDPAVVLPLATGIAFWMVSVGTAATLAYHWALRSVQINGG